MEQKKQEPIRDARQLGTAKMLILGLQHMFAMFGATILVPILVSGYFQKACGEPLTRGLSVSVTLFCAVKCLLNFLDICKLLRQSVHSHHDQIAVVVVPISYIVHELIDSCKLSVV